jgi:hypothetical protein
MQKDKPDENKISFNRGDPVIWTREFYKKTIETRAEFFYFAKSKIAIKVRTGDLPHHFFVKLVSPEMIRAPA